LLIANPAVRDLRHVPRPDVERLDNEFLRFREGDQSSLDPRGRYRKNLGIDKKIAA